MNDNIIKFMDTFQKIKDKGWIKSVSNSDGSVGITFEALLGKKENNLVAPDYDGIELKCTASKYDYPITLFSINFDGPTKYETQRLANLYGKRDTIIKDKNTIYAILSCNADYIVNRQYRFRLKIDYELKRIYLVISDMSKNLIEKKCYIEFSSLQKHLYTKMNYLAMITANKKIINNKMYFEYTNLDMYRLRSFDYFIKALRKSKLNISLILRISKSKANYGTPSYKNITFAINKDFLKYIFIKMQKN